MHTKIAALGAFNGAIAVLTGAFGAHGLKGLLANGAITERQLTAFETGAEYHLLHAVLLVVIGLQPQSSLRTASALCISLGMVLFSGSLYVYGVSGNSIAAMFTPPGGISYLVGWICLAGLFWRGRA